MSSEKVSEEVLNQLRIQGIEFDKIEDQERIECLKEANEFYKIEKDKELKELKGESLAMRWTVYETEQAIERLNEKFSIIAEAKSKQIYEEKEKARNKPEPKLNCATRPEHGNKWVTRLGVLGGNDKNKPGRDSIF